MCVCVALFDSVCQDCSLGIVLGHISSKYFVTSLESVWWENFFEQN